MKCTILCQKAAYEKLTTLMFVQKMEKAFLCVKLVQYYVKYGRYSCVSNFIHYIYMIL